MSNKSRNVLATTVLLIAIITGFLFRSWFAEEVMPPSSRMQTETTQSYRYSKMISEYGSIPLVDSMVMYPEGMITSQNSIFEEYIAGSIHRITGGDYDDFIRFFCLLFPLLTIPFLFLWMRAAGFNLFCALGGSSLYAFLLPALIRPRGESFYRETVALPILAALAWLIEKSLSSDDLPGTERKKTAVSITAGVLLFLFLASWKVSLFITIFLFLYLYWRNFRKDNVPYSLRICLASAFLAAAVILSHMRHDGAIFSPASVLAVLLILPRPKAVWIPAAGTVLAFLAAFAGPGSGGHVSAVIAAKIRFMFSHPSDPSLLSPDARLFWVPGYTSPTPAQVLLLFGIPLAVSVPGMKTFVQQNRGKLLFWFLVLSTAGYLFFDRLLVLPAIALVPVIALSLRKKLYLIPVAGLILLQSIFPANVAEIISSCGLNYRDTSSLLTDNELDSFFQWIQRETDNEDAFLSFWHISGLVSAYAERPVVTHTFFENSSNRSNIVKFARTMFMPEDSLTALMREKECSLVVYQADFFLDDSYSGLLYLAGLTSIPADAVILKMQYSPWMLDSLTPVFSGPSLWVFRLGDTPDTPLPRQFLFSDRYRHCIEDYDSARSIMSDVRAASGYLADKGIEMNDADMLSAAMLLGVSGGGPQNVTQQMLNDLIQMYIHGIYTLDYLAEDIETFTFWCGRSHDLRILLARFYTSESRFGEAEIEYRQVLEEDPGNEDAAAELWMIIEGRQR